MTLSDLDYNIFCLPIYSEGKFEFCEISIDIAGKFCQNDISALITNTGRQCKLTFVQPPDWLEGRYIMADPDANDEGAKSHSVEKFLSYHRGPGAHMTDPIEKTLVFDLPMEVEPYLYDKFTQRPSEDGTLTIFNEIVHSNDRSNNTQINLVFRGKQKDEYRVKSIGAKVLNYAFRDRTRNKQERDAQHARQVEKEAEIRRRVEREMQAARDAEINLLRRQLEEATNLNAETAARRQAEAEQANNRRRDREARDQVGDDDMTGGCDFVEEDDDL